MNLELQILRMHQPHIDIFHDYKKKKKELQMEGRNNLNVPVNTAFTLKQKNYKFEATLHNLTRPCLKRNILKVPGYSFVVCGVYAWYM